MASSAEKNRACQLLITKQANREGGPIGCDLQLATMNHGDIAVADEERHTPPPLPMDRIAAQHRPIATMLHLPNSAGDKDRLQ